MKKLSCEEVNLSKRQAVKLIRCGVIKLLSCSAIKALIDEAKLQAFAGVSLLTTGKPSACIPIDMNYLEPVYILPVCQRQQEST